MRQRALTAIRTVGSVVSNPLSLGHGGHGDKGTSALLARLAHAREAIASALRLRRKTFRYVDRDGRLPLCRKVVFGAPQFSMPSLTMLIAIHGTVFFTSIGARLSFISFFTALARSFDVITDPVMGYVSDNTRTRHGRRRPYMAIGCWGYALAFIALFSPPASLAPTGVALWFGFFYIVFYLFDTVTNVPYIALGPELTDDSEERNSLFYYAGLFKGVGILLAAVAPVGATLYFQGLPSDDGLLFAMACNCTLPPPAPAAAAAAAAAAEVLPAAHFFNASACASLLEARVHAKAAEAAAAAAAGSSSTTAAAATAAVLLPVVTTDTAIAGWCDTVASCERACTVGASRNAFSGVAIFFCVFYLLAMLTVVATISERNQPNIVAAASSSAAKKKKKKKKKKEKKAAAVAAAKKAKAGGEAEEAATASPPPPPPPPPPPANEPLVPSLMAVLRNKPFVGLLPAWVCDYVAFSMIGTMLPFYVQYVVDPASASPWCDDGKRCPNLLGCRGYPTDAACCAPAEESAVFCDANTWLGLGLVALMGATIVSMPLWLWAASRFGKVNAWFAYNLITAITNGLFVMVSQGQPLLMTGLAFLNGLPNGAQFLTDSILADVIDYDEFLTGKRSEGRFTIFTTFIPKVGQISLAVLLSRSSACSRLTHSSTCCASR